MKGKIWTIVFVILAAIAPVYAIDNLMAMQGSVYDSGQPLSGNLTITIWDAPTGGTLLYDSQSEFNNAVANGRFDVVLGQSNQLSLDYGTYYYMDMSVNGQDLDFGGSERQKFQSNLGNVSKSYIKTSGTWAQAEIPSLTSLWSGTLDASRIINAILLNVNNSDYLSGLTRSEILSNDSTLSSRIFSLNSSANMKSLGFNTTSELNNLYYLSSNPSGYISSGSLGNYYLKSEVYNKTESDARYLQSYTETDPIFLLSNGTLWSVINQNSTSFQSKIDANSTALIALMTPISKLDSNSTVFSGRLDTINSSLQGNSTVFSGRLDRINLSLQSNSSVLSARLDNINSSLQANSTAIMADIDQNSTAIVADIDQNSTQFILDNTSQASSISSLDTRESNDNTTQAAAINNIPIMYVPTMIVLRNNTYISPAMTSTAAGTILTVTNTLKAVPFLIGRNATVDQIQFRVTTLVIGANCTAGVYTDDGTGYPSTLVVNGSNQSATTTGLKTNAIPRYTFQRNTLYWAVLGCGLAPTVQGVPIASILPILGRTGANDANFNVGWTVNSAYNHATGALPSSFPAGGTLVSNAIMPMVELRVRTD